MAIENLFRDFKAEVSDDFKHNDREHQRLREEIHRERSERQNEVAKVWTAVDALRNRLPLWATLIIGFLASVCGGSLTILANFILQGRLP